MAVLLDTDVLSELRKPRPNPLDIEYFVQQPAAGKFISIVSIAELRFGISLANDPSQREDLGKWLTELLPLFQGLTLELSVNVLLRWRILLDDGRKRGRTYAQPDLFLAATALEHDLTLVTRNTRDFAEIPRLRLTNPWEGVT